MIESAELTEEQHQKLIQAFNPAREEQIKAMSGLIAVMTISRIINHQMTQTIKIFKNSMKEFSKEEREKIEEIALNCLMDPVDRHVRKQILEMD